jgi:non-ribosomal peptide synthase protein (TIGR01720 family)
MHWLRERGGPIDRFHQAMLLRVPGGLRPEDLCAALQAVLDHHDGLRLRLPVSVSASEPQDWTLEIAPPGTVRASECLRRVDIAGLDEADLLACIQCEAQASECRLAPAAGMMLQAVWFDAGVERAGRLLLTIHHLSVDGVSWRILVPDLAACWQALAGGRTPVLAACGTSLRRWGQRLAAEAQDARRVAELGLWREMLSEPSFALVQGSLAADRDLAATAQHVTLELPIAPTRTLLTQAAAAFHAGINDVLLSALVLALADFRLRRGQGGAHAVLLDLEGHGREEIFGDVDLSRTVGWFTSLYPVRLDPGGLDLPEALAGGPALGHLVKRIKEQLRAIPDHGLGYGLLRYLNADTACELAGFAGPQIGFNYLGRFPAATSTDWSGAPEALGMGGDPAARLAHAVDINAFTRDGADGPMLVATWSWAPALIADADVQALARGWFAALQALVQHVLQPQAGGRTPSDLPLVKLSQAEIERLERMYAR